MKKKIIVVLVVAAALAALLVYYKFWAKGYLYLQVEPAGTRVDVANKTIATTDKPLRIWLPKGNHSLFLSKDGFLSFSGSVDIKPLRKTARKISLGEMFFVGAIGDGSADSQSVDLSSVAKFGQNEAIFYLSSDRSFHKIDLSKAEKTYLAPNDINEKIDIDLKLDGGDVVKQIKYSPKATSALLFVEKQVGTTEVKLVDFANKRVDNLPSGLRSISWQSDSKLIALQDDSNDLVVVDKNSPNKSSRKYEFGEGNIFIFPLGSNDVIASIVKDDGSKTFIINLDNGQTKDISVYGDLAHVFPSPYADGEAILISSLDGNNFASFIKSDGTVLPMQIFLDGTNVSWIGKDEVIYISKLGDESEFHLYNTKNGGDSVIKNYTSDSVVTSVFSWDKYIYFESDGALIGFEKNKE